MSGRTKQMIRTNRNIVAATLGVGLFITAGAAAMAFNGDPPPALIEDVRVGERGQQTRIALFCRMECRAESLGDGEFFLAGAGDNFDIDISQASERALSLRAEAAARGSVLMVRHVGDLARASAQPCRISGRQAACLDLYFAEEQDAPSFEPAAPAQAAKEPAPTQDAKAPPAQRPTALREADSDRLNAFADLKEPERLAPPILAKVQPIEKAIPVATPTLRTTTPLSASVQKSFAGRIEVLLGKTLSPAYCNNAEATLQTDAWALSAMVDVGLCAAARGDAVEAESILSRLLEYTPDNYEALVGKAVIAEQAGERGAALRYYQEALDALPPVSESARIVEAMAALA